MNGAWNARQADQRQPDQQQRSPVRLGAAAAAGAASTRQRQVASDQRQRRSFDPSRCSSPARTATGCRPPDRRAACLGSNMKLNASPLASRGQVILRTTIGTAAPRTQPGHRHQQHAEAGRSRPAPASVGAPPGTPATPPATAWRRRRTPASRPPAPRAGGRTPASPAPTAPPSADGSCPSAGPPAPGTTARTAGNSSPIRPPVVPPDPGGRRQIRRPQQQGRQREPDRPQAQGVVDDGHPRRGTAGTVVGRRSRPSSAARPPWAVLAASSARGRRCWGHARAPAGPPRRRRWRTSAACRRRCRGTRNALGPAGRA